MKMRRSSGLTVALAGLALALAGCGGEDAADETMEAPATDAPASEGMASGENVPRAAGTLANPNLMTEDELAGLEGLPEAAAAAIREGRPFLDMLALDAALAPHMDSGRRAELYRTLWVPLDLNGASEEEILLIPGVGDRMAHEFEEYRPYDAMARFRREIGKYVDDAEVERLAAYVFVPIDLNTATDEEILAIPGVGDRMLHEFKEYRPYTSMDQFRREIGKYVDDAEIERLARYVTIR